MLGTRFQVAKNFQQRKNSSMTDKGILTIKTTRENGNNIKARVRVATIQETPAAMEDEPWSNVNGGITMP